MAERNLIDKLRGAVQFCKKELGFSAKMTDQKFEAGDRMLME